MEPLEFLEAVLPSSGVYCVQELSTPARERKFVTDVAHVQQHAETFSALGRNAYFALAAFHQAGSREAANARCMRALFVDIDAEGREYTSPRQALKALLEFCNASGLSDLGRPWVVDSGGGLHVYWPLAEDAPVAQWKPVAEALKRACKAGGLDIDMTVTADAARVLRVPGTMNFKYGEPRRVALKLQGDVFQLEDLSRVVGAQQAAPAPAPASLFDLPGAPPRTAPSDTTVKLLDSQDTLFKNILVKSAEGTGCAQVLHYLQHAQDSGMEPLWRGLLSLTKVCTDGLKAARKLSSLHPYTEERMQQKLRDIKGPYPCSKLDSENPGVCPGCPHWGKITNPLRLGVEVPLQTEEKVFELVLDPTDIDAKPVSFVRPEAPRGFGYGRTGGVFARKTEEDVEGNSTTKEILILPYDLFVVDVLHVGSVHMAHLVALRPEGPQVMTFPLRNVVSKDDTTKFLAEQNVVSAFGAGNDKNLHEYVRACVEEASVKRKPTVVPTQYGWQEDNSFVLGGKIYMPDGSERSVPMPGLENLTMATRPSGSLDGWRRIVDLLTARQMYDILTHAAIGFGSPLMRFTGLRGMTFHAGHRESGTGKSLALSLMSSVWGNPVDYRTGKSTSPVAMQQRAGNLNSLPFACDELTVKARADSEWFPAWVFDHSEGRGKERMEAGANKERVNTSTWHSIAMFTSNTFMLDLMTGARQHSAEGEIRRFLEWAPAKKLHWTSDELEIVRSLNQNYGTAGVKYAKWLVRNRDTAAHVVQQVTDRLYREFGATNDERFWVAGCAAIIAGAILAGPKHADIVEFPVRDMVPVLKSMVQRARVALRTTKRSAEDVLNEYTRENYGQMVVVTRSGGGLLAKLGTGELIDETITRTKVAGRIERNVTVGYIDYFIDEKMLKRHCASMSYGYADFLADIEAVCHVEHMRKDLLAHIKGPQMRVYAVRISRKIEAVDGDEEIVPQV
jgi:hypothetical protein